MAIDIMRVNTPKASGKHVSLPKQCILCRNSGSKNVEINDPEYAAKVNVVAKCCKCFSC